MILYTIKRCIDFEGCFIDYIHEEKAEALETFERMKNTQPYDYYHILKLEAWSTHSQEKTLIKQHFKD